MPFIAAIAPAIGAISTVAGVVASVGGGIVAGQAAKQSADYNAKVAENNAQIAQRNATIAGEEGAAHAEQSGEQTAQRVGKAKAIFGAAGIDPLSGSASDTEAGITSAGLTDKQTILSNSARTAWGYETQISNFQGQAELDKMQGANAQESSFLSGGVTGLNDWLKYGNSSNLNTSTASS